MNRHHALAALWSLAAAGGFGGVSEAQTLQALHLAAPPTEDMTNTYYGIKSGTFQRAGLDLDFYPTSSGSAAANVSAR